MSEFCLIRVEMDESIAPHFSPDLEDVVKRVWGHMTPWFTYRHGVRNGEISLNDGSVKISWNYAPDDEDATP